jgi:hypothetical protein
MARILRCEPGSRKVGAIRLEQGTPIETSAGAEALLNRPNLAEAKELIKEARYRGEKIVVLSATDQPIVDDQAPVTLAALRGAGLNVELQANDQVQVEAYSNEIPYVPTGQFVVPTAYRKNLDGIIIAPVVFLWKVGKK